MRPAATTPSRSGPYGALAELGERAVEADRLVGVVVERGLDQEVADQREDDPREVSGDAERREGLAHARLISSVFESSRNFFLRPL